mmetsp:Transcript_25051/g.54471  ORF Transcript_25051/g.54471 Transcript_25051/m.54471 type:complete len:503 (-) Transcript_25051:595-2103(-)|eukprot:CAMPEP_0202891498 /NCGR_PEP_ID=MMETSP1392-20130828/1543_1 /ASSEMBLY_ACC=CAM_ASM_000868 /TAXON_ID=225041 /ORGANISM="Chlamydomonas chlamydogama, Strain SAG 11-48b" /LENGTH=502 /DNA_ID=CAMNT_0049575269 /DNA_START=97 /DNA_END=1605 /DNA_ORIENTATION=+
MGSTFSSANSVYVYTEKPSYFGGDLVQGYVLLNCTKPFQCDRVMLKVEGCEKVRWEERREDRNYNSERQEWDTRVEIIPRYGHREFFSVAVPLYSYPQYCQPGQYQFPFSFVLPVGLPGSFQYTDNNYSYGACYYNYTKAQIKYKVKAECVVPGMLKPNVRHKQEVFVNQRLLKSPSEIRVENTQTVNTCCCCGNGTCRVIANVQKDSYMPGEMAAVVLQVENNSTAEFRTIDLYLRRRLRLNADGAAMRELDDELTKASFPGLGPNTSFMGAEGKLLSIALPPQLIATTQGQLISCEYHLIVHLRASAFVSDVKLKVPVTVYMPAPEHITYTQAPSWWHATVTTQPVQVALPSAPPIAPPQQGMEASRAFDPTPAMYPGQPGGPAAPPPQQQQQQQGGFPGQPGAQQGGYPGGQPGGFPPQQGGYPGGQPGGFPPQQQGGYPGYPQQQGGYPGMPGAFPGQQQGGYPGMPQGTWPQQQGAPGSYMPPQPVYNGPPGGPVYK